MFKQVVISLLLIALASCKDTPYQEPKVVQPLAKSEHNFNGMVELGTPISGATVSAYEFSKLSRGEKIAEALSGPNGTFDLNFKTSYDGPILLVATGGLYRDLITGEIVALKPGQELQSAITHIKMPEKNNINAWTTLAVARVLANRGFWDKSIAELKDSDRIDVDFSQISYFLTGKSTSFVNIRRQGFFDVEKDTIKPNEPKSTLHLAHGGLAVIAKNFSNHLAKKAIIISVMDVILALCDDLSDRVFDGRNARAATVSVGKDEYIKLDSYTMRNNFGDAIRLYFQHLQGRARLSSEAKSELERPGQLIDSIANETQPELFPEIDKPKPIDRTPPTLKIQFAGAHREFKQFDFLKGDVRFEVQAEDDSEMAAVKILEPEVIGHESENNFGPISFDYAPQAKIAAEVCNKTEELKNDVLKNGLRLENILCACFEAVDKFGNSRTELSCFQRPSPKSIISYPAHNSILSSRDFNVGASVQAEIMSGLPIKSCSWRIQTSRGNENSEQIVQSGDGLIDKTTCKIDKYLDGSKFFNGTYQLIINAEDIAGRRLNNEQDEYFRSSTEFQVYTEPPPVEVNLPGDYGYLANKFISVSGSVNEPSKIKEIEISYRGLGLDNTGLMGSTKVKPLVNNWSVSLGNNLASGEYIVDLLVKDIYGNEQRLPSIKLTIDLIAPRILGALDGVPQVPYLQEMMNYKTTLKNDEDNPHYVVEPIGKATPIDWQLTPRIHRWLSRLTDSSSAPRYSFRVEDDVRLKEVRYSLNYTCASLENADKTAQERENGYEIVFTPRDASFDLKRDSEEEGYNRKYCLSIWAVDQAGNTRNHKVEFIWKVVQPPISVDMNSPKHRAYLRWDDLAGIHPVSLFVGGVSGCKNYLSCVRRGVVVGHAIISNPYSEAISARLELRKPLSMRIDFEVYSLLGGDYHKYYRIPSGDIDIIYFEYDLKKDEIGQEKVINDSSVIINGKEAVLARFELKNNFFTHYDALDAYSGEHSKIKVEFQKSDGEHAVVDGLRVLTHAPYSKLPINEYTVPWGKSHYVRYRTDLSPSNWENWHTPS